MSFAPGMQVITDAAADASLGPSTVAIGIFDGVHRGHQQLLELGRALATEHHLHSAVCTFYPHPAHIVRPLRAPQLIEPLRRRLRRFEALGHRVAVVQRFDAAFAQMSPFDFVTHILAERLQAKHVIVGSEFIFGAQQRGNVAALQRLGRPLGISVHALPLLTEGNAVVSSSRIRQCVMDGDLIAAANMLGRPPLWEGRVVHGAHRGQALGFGTANLAFDNELGPKTGVYAGLARGPFGSRTAIVNVGVAPTFGHTTDVRMEVHLLHYSGADLYNTYLEVELFERLRDEEKFPSIEALKLQIHRDIRAAATCMEARHKPVSAR